MGKNFLALLAWLVVGFTAAAIGALASVDAPEFYGQLARPAWAPPSWLFGPVWTVLYTLMSVAAWLVWREGGFKAAPIALSLFLIQLALNALWSWLFFVWRLGAAAFAEILLLCGVVLCTLISFWRIRPAAGALLIPYLAWVAFAAALAYSVWQRNPALLAAFSYRLS